MPRRLNLYDAGIPVTDLNQPTMAGAPISIHRKGGAPDNLVVLTCFKSMTWVIETKDSTPAGKIAVINWKLQDYGKSPTGETEVQFRLTSITLEPMLRSMAYITPRYKDHFGRNRGEISSVQRYSRVHIRNVEKFLVPKSTYPLGINVQDEILGDPGFGFTSVNKLERTLKFISK
ncbi:hypothetical protein RJ641_036940, partial [Dillenia turbinata]